MHTKLIPARAGTVSLKQRLVRADGTVGWMNIGLTYAAGVDPADDYLVAVGADVTEQYRHQLQLHHQARHDPLTGLPNRRHLLEAINRCTVAAGGELVGLCFADLDHFKNINDRYGHMIGDDVLAAVATRLRVDSRDHRDYLIARMGGDEFVAFIPPPTTTEHVTAIALRLAAVFREPVTAGGHSLQITASIGEITTHIADKGAESLLAAADTGLYYAKQNRLVTRATTHTTPGSAAPTPRASGEATKTRDDEPVSFAHIRAGDVEALLDRRVCDDETPHLIPRPGASRAGRLLR